MVAAAFFLEKSPFVKDFALDKPWDHPINSSVTPYASYRAHFQCPATTHQASQSPAQTDYVGIAGLGLDAPTLPANHPRAGVFSEVRDTKIADIVDGTSNTMMVVETSYRRGPWIAGGYATVRPLDPSVKPYLGPGNQFGGIHQGGANVLFVDGSVRFVGDSINPRVFEGIATIAGSEDVTELTKP